MQHATPNPLFAKASEIFAAPGRTLPSTSSDKPKPSRPQVSAKTKEAIARLGLRYRPTSQTDLEGHAGQLAMLASDLHDIPVDMLERAIGDWVVRSPYMPKAFDLVQLAKGYLPKPVTKAAPTDWEKRAQAANDQLHSQEKGRRDIRWVAIHDGMMLEFDRSYRSDMERFMDRLDAGQMNQRGVDHAPVRWRQVAAEIGYLRDMGNERFAIRQRRSAIAGL